MTPKGRCKVCDKVVAVQRDGTLRAHGYSNWDFDKPQCAGSGIRGWKLDAEGCRIPVAQQSSVQNGPTHKGDTHGSTS